MKPTTTDQYYARHKYLPRFGDTPTTHIVKKDIWFIAFMGLLIILFAGFTFACYKVGYHKGYRDGFKCRTYISPASNISTNGAAINSSNH